MNEQLQAELAAWLADVRHSAEGMTNWAVDQAPGLIRDVVTVGRVMSGAGMLFGLACLVLALLALLSDPPKDANPNDKELFDNMTGGLFIFFGAACLFFVLWNFHGFVTSWFGPRIYVLEYLASLLK